MIGIGMALAAGVSVFGLENRAGTQRFLNHLSARPGLVWLVKLTIWCLGLAAIWGPQVMLIEAFPPPVQRESALVAGGLAFPIAFTIAQLCGMAIRRGITALIAASVLTMALAVPLIPMVFTLLVPLWGLPVLPIVLLVVSWAWSGDWLRDRPSPGRWVRLGLLAVGAVSVLTASYASYRVLSVPNMSLIAAPASWIEAAGSAPAAERNAADLYREAQRLLNSQHVSDQALYVTRTLEALDLVRRAAARPECRFESLDRLAATDGLDLLSMDRLAELVMLDANECQKSGRLDGAWDDILVLFRMAKHLSEVAVARRSLAAWEIEREGLGLAMEWTVAPKQTPERLRAALATYQALPRMNQVADVVRALAHLTEKRLSLPIDQIRGEILAITDSEPWRPVWLDAITMPWEIVRARRVNRALAAAFLQAAVQKPFQRLVSSSNEFSTPELDYDRQSTPLAYLLIPNVAPYLASSDRNEVGRQALVQLLALRTWQLEHDGQFPDRLAALVPEALPILPDDPYTGRPFGYIRSEGQTLSSLRHALRYSMPLAAGTVELSNVFQRAAYSSKPTPGYWLLYSAGPNLRDDHGDADGGRYGTTLALDPRIPYDLVFPIPPLEGGSAKR
jgi:hypothetical protein